MKFTSWEKWFESKETNAIIDQSKQELLFNHFNTSVTGDQLIRNIKDKDKAFFSFARTLMVQR